jgi:hypothetical protein
MPVPIQSSAASRVMFENVMTATACSAREDASAGTGSPRPIPGTVRPVLLSGSRARSTAARASSASDRAD